MRNHLSIIAALIALASPLMAQTPIESQASQRSAVAFHLSNNGILGISPSGSDGDFYYPRGSKAYYLFDSGLWFGALKRIGDSIHKVAFVTMNPNSGTGDAWPGEARPGNAVYSSPLFSSVEVDHTSGQAIAGTKPAWPLWQFGQDPITMLSPGTFIRDSAERVAGARFSGPAFVPGVDEEFISRFNDTAIGIYEVGVDSAKAFGFPLGLQMQSNVYGWSSGPFASCVLVRYEIVNVGPDTLRECYVGQMSDMDLGAGGNDHLAWYDVDSTLQAMIAWSGAEPARQLGSLLIAAIETPVVDPGTHLIDNTRRTRYDLQTGLTGARTLKIQHDARWPSQRYDLLAAHLRDGDYGEGDQRGIMSSGPFDFPPGDTAYFAIAYEILGTSTPLTSSFTKMIGELARNIRGVYYGQPPAAVDPETFGGASSASITVRPNPATSSLSIEGMLPGATSAEIGLADPLGRSLLAPRTVPTIDGRVTTGLDISGLEPGIYFVVVKGKGMVRTVKVCVE